MIFLGMGILFSPKFPILSLFTLAVLLLHPQRESSEYARCWRNRGRKEGREQRKGKGREDRGKNGTRPCLSKTDAPGTEAQ